MFDHTLNAGGRTLLKRSPLAVAAASHVEIALANPEPRPGFWLEDLRRADFFAIHAPQQKNFELRNVTDFRVALVPCRKRHYT
jgi:hypothetical protein